jgi:hypothetical protein
MQPRSTCANAALAQPLRVGRVRGVQLLGQLVGGRAQWLQVLQRHLLMAGSGQLEVTRVDYGRLAHDGGTQAHVL